MERTTAGNGALAVVSCGNATHCGCAPRLTNAQPPSARTRWSLKAKPFTTSAWNRARLSLRWLSCGSYAYSFSPATRTTLLAKAIEAGVAAPAVATLLTSTGVNGAATLYALTSDGKSKTAYAELPEVTTSTTPPSSVAVAARVVGLRTSVFFSQPLTVQPRETATQTAFPAVAMASGCVVESSVVCAMTPPSLE